MTKFSRGKNDRILLFPPIDYVYHITLFAGWFKEGSPAKELWY